MGFLTGIIQELPLYLLSIPVVLMALSMHESAHGYVAYKLGDPTARNLGRITLNPIKHFDIFGFLCMVLVHFGWAKPVPIVTRNFKNPRRDMAITGAAGPISNLLLAFINLIILRLAMLLILPQFSVEADRFFIAAYTGNAFTASLGFTIVSLLVYILQLGVTLNVVLAIFNLIPIPPFDGSRIFYVFLPPKWYFGIMKYEQYIMIGFFVLLAFGFLSRPLGIAENFITNGMMRLVGMGDGSDAARIINRMNGYVYHLLGFELSFS